MKVRLLFAVFLGAFTLSALTVAPAAPQAPTRDAEEPLRWLREYIQIDTTNPPGNERRAAEYLAAILEAEGIPVRLLESPGGRTSLYARLASPASGGRGVALLHHMDVVPAGEGWSEEPFSARPKKGRVWGRGAIDAKSLGIAQLAALVEIHRAGIVLERDLVYLAVADEEKGGHQGTAWLLEAHPELFEGVEAVINEGGSNRVLYGHLAWWGIEVTQKRPLWLRVSSFGRGGHASGWNPSSPTHRLVQGLDRLIDMPQEYRVTPAARLFLGALAEAEGGDAATLSARLDELIGSDGPTETLPPGMPVYFVDTLQVTAIDTGTSPNVAASDVSAAVDIRLLPDTDSDAYLARVREALGPQLQVEVTLTAPEAPASPLDHPLFQAFEEALGVRAPVVPLFISGTTDSRYFRQRGIPAYGFSPFTLDAPELRGIHAADERIPADDFLRGVEAVRRVLLTSGAKMEGAGGDGG